MHFLRKDELRSRRVTLRACVEARIEREGRTRRLVVEGPLRFTKGTEFAPLPPDVTVLDSEGNRLEPTWGFWVSLETFDPYHLVTDWDGTNPR